MTSLDSVLNRLNKFSKVIFATQHDPSNILAVVPEKGFIDLLKKSSEEILDFRYLEKRERWLDVHMVMVGNLVPLNITFRLHNPSEELIMNLTAKYPSSSSFV
ncbi:MAG: hypothetical protein ACTSR2_12620 [Candidatus Hodarchaeales archaeon]